MRLFRSRIAGDVERANAMWQYPPPISRGSTVAQKAGLRFESKVLRYLTKAHPHFISHLPFIFFSHGARRHAIPDGLCFSRDLDILTIVEIKNKHTEEAWQQLNLLYLPVVQRAFPRFQIKLLEICHWFEPHIKLPGKTIQVIDPVLHFDSVDFDYGICIWKGV